MRQLGSGSLTVDPGLPGALAAHVADCRCGQNHDGVVRHLERMSIALMPNTGEQVLETGELEVDVAAIWRMMADSIYAGGDLPALAVREMLQNSVDAIRKAYRTGVLAKGTGTFEVTWDGEGTLTAADNGTGMDQNTLRRVFLKLGATGKAGDPEAAGGFGAAKAVILGASRTGEWEVWTRDIAAQSTSGIGFRIVSMPERTGTQITLRGVETAEIRSKTFNATMDVATRLRYMLQLSNVPDVTLYYNGERIDPFFPGRRGSILEEYEQGDWGPKTTARVKSYVRAPGTGSGAFYVRLNGLFQFARRPWQPVKFDVTVDITTQLRPQDRSPAYTFNAARDAFNDRSYASYTFSQMMEDFIRESQSVDRPKEYDTLVADATDAKERAGASEFADTLAATMDDPEFKAAFDELMGLAAQFYKEEFKQGRTLPGATGDGADQPPATREGQDPYEGFREAQVVLDAADLSEGAGKLALGDVVLKFVGGSGNLGDLDRAGWATDAITTLQTGGDISGREATALIDVVQRATQQIADNPERAGESIIPVAAEAAAIAEKVVAAAERSRRVYAHEKEEIKAKARQSNPFGSAAMVKISRVNYDKAKAKKFLKGAGKYMGMLAAWDLILRMVATEAKVTIAFRPGFILDDAVRGVCVSEGEAGRGLKNYILLHPDPVTALLKVHKERPWAVAGYLRDVACHELAHLPRIGQGDGPHGHDEAWAVQREDLSVATEHLLPAMEKAVIAAFQLPKPASRGGSTAEDRNRIQRYQADAERERKKAKELAAELAAAKAAATSAEHKLQNHERLDRDIRERERAAHQAEVQRLQGLVEDRTRPVRDVVAKLEALVKYHEFRDWLRARGTPFLPSGLTGPQLLALFDEHPDRVAEFLVRGPVSNMETMPLVDRAGSAARRVGSAAQRVSTAAGAARGELLAVDHLIAECAVGCLKEAAARRYGGVLGGARKRLGMESMPVAAPLAVAGEVLAVESAALVSDAAPCIAVCSSKAMGERYGVGRG